MCAGVMLDLAGIVGTLPEKCLAGKDELLELLVELLAKLLLELLSGLHRGLLMGIAGDGQLMLRGFAAMILTGALAFSFSIATA